MKFLMKMALIAFTLPLFANGVATITALKGTAKIENASGDKNAILGSSLEEKDSVVTADKSKVQIIFKDETIVTVGKNSNFSISKYIFEENKEPTVEFSLVKGAMRTITGRIGKMAPQKFSVKTKTATIGIRGTNFTIIAMEDGSQRAYCTYGAISVTVNGEQTIVRQGFYVSYSAEGKAQVKAFTAEELKEVQDDSFGESAPLTGEATEETETLEGDAVVDNTVEDNSFVVKDVTAAVQDAIQNSNPGANVIITGFSVDNDNYDGMTSKVSLSFAADGSIFDSSNSWLELLGKSNSSGQGESDNWKFVVSSTPASYSSRNNFSTTFSSVELTPISSSTSVNAALLGGSSLIATTDLAVDDSMSWGTWNATVNFESVQSGSLTSDSHTFEGLWVAGEATPVSVIDSLLATGAAAVAAESSFTSTYVGQYSAIGGGTQNGNASLYVDFGYGTADLTISDYSINNFSMAISGNTMSADTFGGGGTGIAANGTFYGANGKSVGGNFYINDGSTTNVKGVYQVTEQAGGL